MKQIVLKFDDDAFRFLNHHIGQTVGMGLAYGVPNRFLVELMRAMNDGEQEKHFKLENQESEYVGQDGTPN